MGVEVVPLKYTKPAIILHWLVAAGLIANVALAWIWPHLSDERVRPTIDVHKSLGITILGLAILRLLWRASHRPPPYPTSYARWERALSHMVHILLYVIIFLMPLSGWIMDSAWQDAATHPMSFFGLFEWPRIAFILHLSPSIKARLHDGFGTMHAIGAYGLYGLVLLHVGGALKHEWLDREREVGRMWFGRP